jgi:DNA-directed RNA polymerase subunit P
MYKCLRCNKEIEEKQIRGKIRCPFCGYRIIIKKETKILKKIKAD